MVWFNPFRFEPPPPPPAPDPPEPEKPVIVHNREENKRRKATAEADFWFFNELDEIDRQAARSYVPDYKVERFPAGMFLLIADHEIPLRFVEDITVSNHGSEPDFGEVWRDSWGTFRMVNVIEDEPVRDWTAFPARRATIKITMNSGREFYVSVNRHCAEMLLASLRETWKAV
jgi:hypothetical protein